MLDGETFALDPSCPVLPRPSGSIQIGWAPRRAVIVDPTTLAPAGAVLELLRGLASEMTLAQIRNLQCTKAFHDPSAIDGLVRELTDAGAVISRVHSTAPRTPTVRVEGHGPLSDALARSLRHTGARLHCSTYHGRESALRGLDLVILADTLVADPRLVRALHRLNIPHIAVRARDGAGLIGPTVFPGVSSCLGCADRHRGDRDDAWPALAAQLAGTVGVASPATVLATAGVALAQIEIVLAAVRGEHPRPDALTTLDTTLELNLAEQSLTARRWAPHPLCGCRAYLARRSPGG